MKIICMIPARSGSKRVPNKNLRMLGGKILMGHVIEKALESGCFDEIWVNSEDSIYEQVAKDHEVGFYKRPEELASDQALNDDLVSDFINNVECDIVVQINTTSPLITLEDIRAVVGMAKHYDTVHSVEKIQIGIIYQGKPLNFSNYKKMPPSQDLVPVHAFCSGIMAWKTKPYKKNMKQHGCATYGCDHNTGYYELKGFSRVDIDYEEDFQLAEAILKIKSYKPKYYESR